MSENLWWPDEHWWERKVLALTFVTLSPLQFFTLLVWAAVSLLISLPFGFPVAGVSFGGRALTFLILLMAGWLITNRKVKMVPVQMQLLYLLRTRSRAKTAGKVQTENVAEKVETERVQEMVVDDFKSPTPLVVMGKLSTPRQQKVILRLDGLTRDEDVVSASKPYYRFNFIPEPRDIGTHDMAVEVEGMTEPIMKQKVVVKAKGIELLESKK